MSTLGDRDWGQGTGDSNDVVCFSGTRVTKGSNNGCGPAVTASAMSGSWQTYVADGESAIGVTDAWRSAVIV